jgi:hypothetical protein
MPAAARGLHDRRVTRAPHAGTRRDRRQHGVHRGVLPELQSPHRRPAEAAPRQARTAAEAEADDVQQVVRTMSAEHMQDPDACVEGGSLPAAWHISMEDGKPELAITINLRDILGDAWRVTDIIDVCPNGEPSITIICE